MNNESAAMPAANTKMVWFGLLNLDDRVALLADPDQALSAELAVQIARPGGGVAQATWPAYESEGEWHLVPEVAQMLVGYRDAMQRWWDSIDDESRKVFLQQRESLPENYRSQILRAVGGVQREYTDGSVSFAPLAAVFLEWKSRQLAQQ